MPRESVALMESERVIVVIAGARPNCVTIGALLRDMRRRKDLKPMLIHTRQHWDSQRSDRFFADLGHPPGHIVERVFHRRALFMRPSSGQVAGPKISAEAC